MQNADRLRVSGRALELANQVFDYTEAFPRAQLFVLVGQMQRAAVSIGANIHEACGKATDRAFIASIHTALGEASELEFHLRLARSRGFGDPALGHSLAGRVVGMKRSLGLLIKNHRPPAAVRPAASEASRQARAQRRSPTASASEPSGSI